MIPTAPAASASDAAVEPEPLSDAWLDHVTRNTSENPANIP